MNPPGHLAVALLSAHYLLPAPRSGVSARALAIVTMIGALTPDLIDKPLMWSGLTPFGRSVGHALLCWAWLGLIALLWPRRRGAMRALLLAWVLGGLSHLLADLADDLIAALLYTPIAWSAWPLWPWFTPDELQWRAGLALWPCRNCWTPLELLIILGALWRQRVSWGRRER